MAILIDKNSKILVQGITGSEGSFHAQQCLDYGTAIVAGVTPGKGGQRVLDNKVPVFHTVKSAVVETQADTSLIFVPPPFAADAILEAIDAGIAVIVCITEGIPVKDMVVVYDRLKKSNSRLIGPNCPGVLTPEEAKVGIMPGFIAKKGPVGVISKSGTLTYEAVDQLTRLGLGQTTCIGIGGDPIVGTSIRDLLQLFQHDKETEAVVMIGEIGGSMEVEAAMYAKENVDKPIVGFIAGETAPTGKRMGHAGAVVSGADESAAAKKKTMRECGINVVDSPADIGMRVKTLLNR